MTGHGIDDRPHPLPIRPRPAAGESVESYIRRLAHANHLRPSYLHGYLCGPPNYLGAIRPERLSALANRPVAVLERVLTGLTRPASDATRQLQQRRRRTRAEDKPELYAAIRRDAEAGHSIRALADRHRVHRRTIRQALADPTPPPSKRPTRRGSTLDRFHEPLEAMLASEPDLTIRQVWERLLDDHDAEVSYSTVREYVIRHPTATSAGRHGQSSPTRPSPKRRARPTRKTKITQSLSHSTMPMQVTAPDRDKIN